MKIAKRTPSGKIGKAKEYTSTYASSASSEIKDNKTTGLLSFLHVTVSNEEEELVISFSREEIEYIYGRFKFFEDSQKNPPSWMRGNK